MARPKVEKTEVERANAKAVPTERGAASKSATKINRVSRVANKPQKRTSPRIKKPEVKRRTISATASEDAASSKAAKKIDSSGVVKKSKNATSPKTKKAVAKKPVQRSTAGSPSNSAASSKSAQATAESGEAAKNPRTIAGDDHGWLRKTPFESCKQVDDRLAQLVPKNKLKSVSVCLKAAILRGFIDLSVGNPLNQIIFVGTVPDLCDGPRCQSGNKSITIRLRDVLYQPDSGPIDEGHIPCPKCAVTASYYLTDMCTGHPMLQHGGKFHKHCLDCPWFGMCLSDYRMFHCFGCNTHQHYMCMNCNSDSE